MSRSIEKVRSDKVFESGSSITNGSGKRFQKKRPVNDNEFITFVTPDLVNTAPFAQPSLGMSAEIQQIHELQQQLHIDIDKRYNERKAVLESLNASQLRWICELQAENEALSKGLANPPPIQKPRAVSDKADREMEQLLQYRLRIDSGAELGRKLPKAFLKDESNRLIGPSITGEDLLPFMNGRTCGSAKPSQTWMQGKLGFLIPRKNSRI
jgi:hypothetical protein